MPADPRIQSQAADHAGVQQKGSGKGSPKRLFLVEDIGVGH
jgi:hypothetical protein